MGIGLEKDVTELSGGQRARNFTCKSSFRKSYDFNT